MMELLVFAGMPILLLLLLWVTGVTRGIEVEEETPEDLRPRYGNATETAQCIRQIFSPEDRDFVERQSSMRLKRIYRAERTRVALFWVRHTSREVRQIMRQHRTAARETRNLNVTREMGLVLRYLEFQTLCGLLSFFIRMFGPHLLKDLATHALEMSQSIEQVLENSTAANRIAPAGNMGGA
jgi:hypothetical protein